MLIPTPYTATPPHPLWATAAPTNPSQHYNYTAEDTAHSAASARTASTAATQYQHTSTYPETQPEGGSNEVYTMYAVQYNNRRANCVNAVFKNRL